ncbi:hypothetical protein PIB30_076702 [Stylosanthes scabra]|uniref:Uncharacterized protein n=1 Tax=Stylosanthes scabra TaxID=79078 RepID=A0ABU6ZP07_9FABA|nr:hypothetical protein [Stylosanthes scabra]
MRNTLAKNNRQRIRIQLVESALYLLITLQLPAHIKIKHSSRSCGDPEARKRKGKCKEGKDIPEPEKEGTLDKERLGSLDIFASCGGLSQGLQQSGNSYCIIIAIFAIKHII